MYQFNQQTRGAPAGEAALLYVSFPRQQHRHGLAVSGARLFQQEGRRIATVHETYSGVKQELQRTPNPDTGRGGWCEKSDSTHKDCSVVSFLVAPCLGDTSYARETLQAVPVVDATVSLHGVADH